MTKFSLVLSDDLLRLYTDFSHGKEVDKSLLQKFLRYYHETHLTCVDQITKIGINDSSLKSQLMSSGYINFEDLYKKTIYKIILDTKNSHYPYININKDSIEKNFSLTFKKNEPRDKAHSLLKSLCENANQIWIFDKYFIDNCTYENLKDFLPRKELKINFCNYLENTNNPKSLELKNNYKIIIKELKKHCDLWNMPPMKNDSIYKDLHDRYLRIEDINKNKIELILSSGLNYLYSSDKDISILIREI